jgi:hypothetical protein
MPADRCAASYLDISEISCSVGNAEVEGTHEKVEVLSILDNFVRSTCRMIVNGEPIYDGRR